MNLTRRAFLISTSALAALGGCRALGFAAGRPRLKFGVISDIHVITPESAGEFVAALEYFRDHGADAVVVCGDLTDWGLLSSLKYVADAWNRVFPGNRAPDGRRVERLFCSGNHDYEGWWYGDMTMEMHALGYSEDEALVRLGFKKCWEEVFHESWAPIRRRTVKGYDFISGEWHGYDKQEGFDLAPAWLEAHRQKLVGERPCFYFQHPPIAETTGDSRRDGHSKPDLKLHRALAGIPNMVTFTGHCHWTFNDPNSIWQGEFTSIAVPSMSYTTVPRGYENGSDVRNGKSERLMPKIDTRPRLEEAQGYLVSVYDDRLEVEKRDFEQSADAGTWVVPWPPAATARPFATEAAAARETVPEFPAGAQLKTYTRNCDNRAGKWAIGMCFDFPSAVGEDFRAFDYEIRAVLRNGETACVKRFLSPAFHKLPKDEPCTMHFYWDVAELPQDTPYRFEVYPRNAFGRCGAPLKSAELRGKPGLGKAVRN